MGGPDKLGGPDNQEGRWEDQLISSIGGSDNQEGPLIHPDVGDAVTSR